MRIKKILTFLVIVVVILFVFGEVKKRLPTINFSPTGEWIAFSCSNGNPIWPEEDVYIIRPDGSQLQQVTYDKSTEFHDWSPDGGKMLVTVGLRYRTITSENSLHTLNSDGSNLTRVVDPNKLPITEDFINYTNYMHPKWSPDGQWIAFALKRYRDADDEVIYLVHPDGTNLHSIYKPISRITDLQWLDAKTLFVNAMDISDDARHTFLTLDIESGATEQRTPGYYDGIVGLPEIKLSNDSTRYGYQNITQFKDRELFIFDETNNEITNFLTDGNDFNWSPDDSRIVFGAVDIQIFELASGETTQIAKLEECYPHNYAWILFDD